MDLINSDGMTELATEDICVGIVELGELQLALIGGGIGDTQL